MVSTSVVNNERAKSVVATKVVGNVRADMLPRYFPNIFWVMENTVYRFTDMVCKQYGGGFWEFYELSNGGFYMAPDIPGTMLVEIPFGNGYEGEMSADALGIVVCLFTYSHLAEQHPESNFADFYWRLRGFAGDHAEAMAIYAAID